MSRPSGFTPSEVASARYRRYHQNSSQVASLLGQASTQRDRVRPGQPLPSLGRRPGGLNVQPGLQPASVVSNFPSGHFLPSAISNRPFGHLTVIPESVGPSYRAPLLPSGFLLRPTKDKNSRPSNSVVRRSGQSRPGGLHVREVAAKKPLFIPPLYDQRKVSDKNVELPGKSEFIPISRPTLPAQAVERFPNAAPVRLRKHHQILLRAENLRLGDTFLANPVYQTSNGVRTRLDSKKLGEGNFGQVFEAVTKMPDGTGYQAARKVIPFDQDAIDEAYAFQLLSDHPNFLQFFAVVKVAENLNIITERAGQNLFDILEGLKGSPHLNRIFVRKVGIQIANGLAFMHHLGLIHRDVKPQNILDSDEGLKVADMGAQTEIGKAPKVMVGTPLYIPPEAVSEGKAHPTYDVFSLGATLFEILKKEAPGVYIRAQAGKEPCARPVTYVFYMAKEYSVDYHKYISKKGAKLSATEHVLLRMVHPDPKLRIQSMKEVDHALRSPKKYMRAFLKL